MLAELGKAAHKASTLVRKRLSLLVPMIVMIVVERIFDQHNPAQLIDWSSPWIAWQRLVLDNGHALLILLLVVSTVKAAFVLFSNEDIGLGFDGRGRERYSAILGLKAAKYYFAYFAFTSLWYLFFFLLGTAIVLVSRGFESEIVAWAIVVASFIVLWPAFYIGLSLSAFQIAMQKHGLLAPGAWRKVVKRNFVALYLFYTIRSIVDLTCLVGGPAVAVVLISDVALRYVTLLAYLAVAVLLIRATSIAYKRALFGLEDSK